MGVWVRGGVAVLSGLVLWLAFPSVNLWWTAPLAAMAFALATAGVRAWQGALLGFLAGVGFFTPLLSWTAVFLGWSLPIFALIVSQSAFTALAGWAMTIVQRRDARGPRAPGRDDPVERTTVGHAAPVAAAAAWTGAEWLRSNVPFGGFGWGRLAFSQADAPALSLVPYVGSIGLSFVVALTGTLLAASVQALVARRGRATLGGRVRVRPVHVAFPAVLAVTLLVGPAVLPRDTGEDRGSAAVMAVQGNVEEPGLDFNSTRLLVTQKHAHATMQAAAEVDAGQRPRPDIVVWPENASDPTRNADSREVITEALDAVGVPMFVGAVLREPADMVTNAVLLFEPGGQIVERYDKQHPVPFAEYMPFRDFFRSITDMVDLLPRDFAHGQRDVVFSVPRENGEPIRIATPICFEVAIDAPMADPVRMGANILAVPTNNATFGFTDESEQQLGISRVRAREFGRSIVHVSTVGVSALITPDGTAHQKTELYTQDVISGDLPLRENMTAATYLGQWPGVATAAVALFFVVLRVRPRR